MPFTTPTQRELIDEVASNFEDEIDDSTPRLPASDEYAISRAVAGIAKGLHDHIKYQATQIFPDSADEINFWRHAATRGITRKDAVKWKGTYLFTGSAGGDVPAETQLTRKDGKTYVTDAELSLNFLGLGTVAITAETEGADWNNEDSQELALTAPIDDITDVGAVQSTTTTGTDQETAAEGLVRLLLDYRTPPSGGGPGDYERWALTHEGVTRAWQFALLEGPNTVSVAFVRDNESPIVPDSTERAACLATIEALAPVTVDVRIITLTAVTVNIVLSALNPNTLEVRDAITESVRDLLIREGGPDTTIALSRIDEAISGGTGELTHVRTTPAADLVFATNEVPVMGTVTVVP